MRAHNRYRSDCRLPTRHADAQLGVTLIELVVMIVVVSVIGALAAGIIGRMGLQSADPLIRRQALIIADSLLQEVLQQPTSDNDPDGGVDGNGPEAGEARGSATAPFDHVNDYNGFAMNGIRALDGTVIAALAGYSASISVQSRGVDNVSASDGWWVEVAVTAPDGTVVRLAGWRARLSG